MLLMFLRLLNIPSDANSFFSTQKKNVLESSDNSKIQAVFVDLLKLYDICILYLYTLNKNKVFRWWFKSAIFNRLWHYF